MMDDEFFDFGNMIRSQNLQNAHRLDEAAILRIWHEYSLSESGVPEPCFFCAQSFSSARERDAHISLLHSHKCSVCGAPFASESWVTRHIQENHDALFQAMAHKGHKMVCTPSSSYSSNRCL
jgi:uncharacterized Zn-finger protein